MIVICSFLFTKFYIIKNVGSSTFHKKNPSFSLSLREFKKIIPNTLIYKLILIKIYMNTNTMKTKIFQFNKYDLKGY